MPNRWRFSRKSHSGARFAKCLAVTPNSLNGGWFVGLQFAKFSAEYGVQNLLSTSMTAIKKTITKSSKSPAPATKTTTSAAKKKVPAVSAPAIAFAPKVNAVAAKPVVTAITARIDVGFGNALYIRGEGPGLSWDKGVLMKCVGDDAWAIALGESARGYTFKFLINDLTWSVGPDFNVEAGQTVTFSPGF